MSMEVDIAIIGEGITHLKADTKEIKAALPKIFEKQNTHSTEIALLKRNNKWMLGIVVFIPGAISLIIAYLKSN